MTQPTLADLLALPAGMELDLAIANLRGMYVVPTARAMSQSEQWQFLPHVSSDIAASWPLLAEMLAAGVWIQFHSWPGGLVLRMGHSGRNDLNVPTLADAPLAIVRAWATWFYGKRGEA